MATDRDLANLRHMCAALMAAPFESTDRLKAILQIAYELLGASSVVAYKWDRAAERLVIFAMPGVSQREMMRGPTREPIFGWGQSEPAPDEWLENEDAFLQAYPRMGQQSPAKDFRNREKRKHGDKGDLALAKIRLYKGVGQTNDRVGQLFFNFWKEDSTTLVFTDELKDAIRYVAKVVRELLIQDLYHSHSSGRNQPNSDSSASLRLLTMIEDRLSMARSASEKGVASFSPDFLTHVRSRFEIRRSILTKRSCQGSRWGQGYGLARRLAVFDKLVEVFDNQERPWLAGDADNELLFELSSLTHEVLTHDLWRMVCRTALEMVETFGGLADVILMMGHNLVRRVVPLQPTDSQHEGDEGLGLGEVFWLAEDSISRYCIRSRKVFCCNNVEHKASAEFKDLFRNEPGIRQYRSLLVVPVVVEGEVRALLRLMSTDDDCFLDRHTAAVQAVAFVAGYALNYLDAFQRQDRIAESLAFFAKGQAVTQSPALPNLLGTACRAVGASSAVYWPATDGIHPFGQGILVELPLQNANSPPILLDPTNENGIRRDGLTMLIRKTAQDHSTELIFCQHVLLTNAVQLHQPPDYILQLFSDGELASVGAGQKTADGFFRYDFKCGDPLPPDRSSIHLSEGIREKRRYRHTQIGFAVKEKETGIVQGVVWLCWDDLHHLGWWERLFLCSVSNYLAQALKASSLRLALRGFRHMMINATSQALYMLEESRGEAGTHSNVVNLPPPATLQRAAAAAEHVLYMNRMKSFEVRALMASAAERGPSAMYPLRDIMRRAWSIATNLGTLSEDFHDNTDGEEHAGQFHIHYGCGTDPDLPVTESLYTASANILSNAVRYGRPPYGVWAFLLDGRLSVLFGNGGDPPRKDLLETCVYGIRDTEEHGVGLAVVKQVVEGEGGTVCMRDTAYAESRDAASIAGSPLNTFFEVVVPYTHERRLS